MKAMIFAAGLGTRLKPVTESIPKALVEVHGKTLLERAIDKLTASGFNEIIINIHHHPEMMRTYLSGMDYPGTIIKISDESDELLDTGGGLMKASWFFDDNAPFLVYNVDILTSLDLQELFTRHMANEALVTLAVSERETSRYLLFDEEGWMKGWTNISTGQVKPADVDPISLMKYAFSGIHIISPQFFDLVKQKGRFSLIESYLDLCRSHNIGHFVHGSGNWIDVGKADLLERINNKPFNRIFDEE